MSQLCNIQSTRRLELSFQSIENGVRLERTVFYNTESICALTSVFSPIGLNTTAYGSFPWSRSVQGMALLLLQYVHWQMGMTNSDPPAINGSLGLSLAKSLATQEQWLIEMFGLERNGAFTADSLFEYRPSSNVVSLTDAPFSMGSLVVVLDGRLLANSIELVNLIDRLKRSCRPLELVGGSGELKAPTEYINPRREPVLEMRHISAAEVPVSLLEIIRSRISLDQSETTYGQIIPKLRAAIQPNLIIHSLQHTTLKIANREADLTLTFEFRILNLGLHSVSSRTHQFWFGIPQDRPEFSCIDNQGNELQVDVTRRLPHYAQINVILQREINPLESYSYTIRFSTRRDPATPYSSYTLSPRTITQLMKLTVIAPYDVDFDNAYVTHETKDGFLRDDPPALLHTKEPERQIITWEHKRPELGDLIRTYWSEKPLPKELSSPQLSNRTTSSERNTSAVSTELNQK